MTPVPPFCPLIAVTMGDPLGIGPEVIVKALANNARRARFVIYGESHPMQAAARAADIEPFWTEAPFDSAWLPPAQCGYALLLDHGPSVRPGLPHRPEACAGAASFAFVEHAIADSLRVPGDPRRPDAVATAPISKESWALAGHAEFPGHTDLLAARCRAPRVRMMFVAPSLRVMLATAHIPLAEVPAKLTKESLAETIALAHDACVGLGVPRPRVAVCGMNPHAGEAGLLGGEESRVIAPAIRDAAARGIDASGPHPADTIFNAAVRGDFDIVVAMYHDQGLIPVKLLAFDRAVNYSAGLPIIRTSPDHGTAFDIAGHNKADPGSMAAAIDLAIRLCRP